MGSVPTHMAGPGGLVGDDGGPLGPFNAWISSPALGGPAGRLGEAVRFGSSLGHRTVELIIIIIIIIIIIVVVVGAHWKVDSEF